MALGHHLDDAVESFFMNIFYNGALRSMAPKYRADRGVIVVRPLIEIRESQLKAFAESNGFQTIGDEVCPAMRVNLRIPMLEIEPKEFVNSIGKELKTFFRLVKAHLTFPMPIFD